MTDLRIVSLNAWGGQCWEALRPWLGTLRVDVLCLQEVIRAPVNSPEELAYVDPYRSLTQRADLFGDICDLLPGHNARFAPAARGYLTDPSGKHYLSEHGIAQWIARDLALVSAWQGFVHGGFRHDGWGAEPVPRAAQVARLATPEGRPVIVAHLHGLRDPAGKGDTPARKAQWHAMAKAITRLRRPGDPVIFAGDLNVLPDSEAFQIFGEIGLVDLVTTRGYSNTRTSLYPKAQRYADYMLVSDGVTVLEFDVPTHPEVSDHCPLILRCQI